MQPAPLYEDIAEGPEGGSAHWITAADGPRLRVGNWPLEGAKGTILIFPGRSEFIEKYGRAAREFAAAGYGALVIDWRGQGLADRLHEDPGLGHVDHFHDYQHDVAAMKAHATALGLPRPYYLIAHSMGGAIGLRALIRGLDVKAAMFSAPMWGVSLSLLTRPYAWAYSTLSRVLSTSDRVVPGKTTTSFREEMQLLTNELTHDPEMLAYMNAHIKAHPELGIGGPSLRWLNETLIETRALARMPSPVTPALTFLGTKETIVDHGRIRSRMARWPGGALRVVEGGKHEMMMELPDIRAQIFSETIAHFDAHP